MKLDAANYWDNRYQTQDTGWDLGEISPPLKNYIDDLEDKSLQILLPGAGNAYEAEYLFNNGFKNVFVLDISETAIRNFENRCPWFPKNQLLHQDFFDLEMRFDLVIEQTFFCALPPDLRSEFAIQMEKILDSGKQLIGLLFDFPLTEKGPPYGGNKAEYSSYFEPYFEINHMDTAKDSHTTRKGKELFIKLKRK